MLHGGPDFDHSYLLPEMDCLAGSFRLIYYDQRGRGRSASHVIIEDVSIISEIEDLERLRDYFDLETLTLLGHSWGGLLSMEYAVRHPERVSHLILMNTAPVSREGYLRFRQDRYRRAQDDMERLNARESDARYLEGDPDTVARYYRIHFKSALAREEHLDTVMMRLRASFTEERILKGRKIEDRLMDQTWLSGEYDLLPKLKKLRIPTLVIHGELDFVPLECAAHIAQAIPGANLTIIKDCGHFSYLEKQGDVCGAIGDFLLNK